MRTGKMQQKRKRVDDGEEEGGQEHRHQQKKKAQQQRQQPQQHVNGKQQKAKGGQHAVSKAVAAEQTADDSGTSDHEDENPKAGQADGRGIWWYRCRRLLLSCLENDHMDVIAAATATWSPGEVMEMCQGWQPFKWAAAFADCSPDRIASLLQGVTPAFASSACESWPPEQLAEVLPLLRTKAARQVLRALYFKSEDPYLTRGEAHTILMAFPPAKRDKLCSKLSQKVVAKVLGADPDDDGSDDERRGDDTWMDGYNGDDDERRGDDSYDSSFVVDDDEVEEGAGPSGSEEEEEEEATSGRRTNRRRVVISDGDEDSSEEEEEERRGDQGGSKRKVKGRQKPDGGGSRKAGKQQLEVGRHSQPKSEVGTGDSSRKGKGCGKRSRQ